MDFSERLGLGGGALPDTLGLQNHLSMPFPPPSQMLQFEDWNFKQHCYIRNPRILANDKVEITMSYLPRVCAFTSA